MTEAGAVAHYVQPLAMAPGGPAADGAAMPDAAAAAAAAAVAYHHHAGLEAEHLGAAQHVALMQQVPLHMEPGGELQLPGK